MSKNDGVSGLQDRLESEFTAVSRTADTDPEIPAILLIEDDDRDAEVFGRVLKETGEPCKLTRVASAEEALQLLQDGVRFQALVVDDRLPGMDGGVFLRMLKGRPGLGDPMVFRYTADTSLDGKLIHKPPSSYELQIAVTAAKMVGMLTVLAAVHGT